MIIGLFIYTKSLRYLILGFHLFFHVKKRKTSSAEPLDADSECMVGSSLSHIDLYNKIILLNSRNACILQDNSEIIILFWASQKR